MTASSEQEAETIAEALVGERLVACANIFQPHRSVYCWDGAVQSGQEIAVIFKTTKDRFEAVEARIKALHSYDVPCIVSMPVAQAHAPFLQWIETETRGQGI